MEQINLEEAIIETKRMMDKEGYGYSEFLRYSMFYFGSNENMNLGLRNLEFDRDEKALCVMSSGDQAFNLIYHGVRQIDTFDINVLSYFIFHLRKAIFLYYGLDEGYKVEKMFCDPNVKPEALLKILDDIKSLLPKDVLRYFYEILNYNCRWQDNVPYCNCFYYLIRKDGFNCGYNLYSRSRKDFQIFQDRLEKAVVNFKCGDITDTFNSLTDKYGLMYFSNIAQHFLNYYEAEDYMELMMKYYPHLKDNGIMINYFFNSRNFDVFRDKLGNLNDMGWSGNTLTRQDNKNYASISRKRVKVN